MKILYVARRYGLKEEGRGKTRSFIHRAILAEFERSVAHRPTRPGQYPLSSERRLIGNVLSQPLPLNGNLVCVLLEALLQV